MLTLKLLTMNQPVVLFLCTGNSARSQMAEALLRHHAGDRFDIHSAGLNPQGIHPLTIQVMQEIGLSLAGHRSKSVDEYLGKFPVRYAITVCENAERECPRLWPFAVNHISWRFADPVATEASSGDQLSRFRETRDAINLQIQQWLNDQTAT